MTTMVVPPLDAVPWPTLGKGVCDFITSFLVFGPGDLRGEPARLDAEKRALIYRMYEVWPADSETPGRRRFKRCAISLRKGSAKALALDTPLPTADGWTTMGDVLVGDVLFDESGKRCNVVATSEVFTDHDCYAVRFRDGSEIVADAGHLWYTEELRNRPYIGSVKTTLELADSVTVRPDGARNHRIPIAQPLELPEAELLVDPWIFGAWLGDGRTDDSEFTTDEGDYQHFLDQIERAGYYTTAPKRDTRRPTTLAIRISVSPIRKGKRTAGEKTLKGLLGELGVLGNKHIPAAYLRASAPQRLALLQGLMDTDGTVDSARKGYCAFTSTLLVLAQGVYELAASLGLKPSLRISKASLKGAKHVSDAWRVSFQAYDDMPVFGMPRKAGVLRPKPTCTPMSTNRHIVSVDKIPSVPTRCIAVDSPSHLFLSGRGMIPTHNTELLAWIVAAELHHKGPVRCDGFNADGQPVGRPVTDPYIPMCAYTEEQSDELAYGALRIILEYSPLVDDFDISLERVMRKAGDGKAVSLASSPDSRDGARTTLNVFDEALALDTPLVTPTGWTTMGEVVVGDMLMGRDGVPCRVIGKSEVHSGRPCYRVSFKDGTSVVADEGHLWYAHRRGGCGHGQGCRCEVVQGWAVRRTADMLDVTYKNGGQRTLTYHVPPTNAYDWRAIASIDPVGSVSTQCVAVDSVDHLYLAGVGMVPTHNTHRFTQPRLKAAHRTMLANIPKRYLSDAWSIEVTTAPAPGEGSVAEGTMDYARMVQGGKAKDSKLFFFHRQASDEHDLSTPEGIREAVLEASGPVAVWSDVSGIVDQWQDPTADKAYLERVWLNRLVRASERAFDVERWKRLEAPDAKVDDGALITIGFDGAYSGDSTALVACHVPSGYLWLAGLWEHPYGIAKWSVPAPEVEAKVDDLMTRYQVWRMYADPPYWETYVSKWAGMYGDERVLEWWTNRSKVMAYSLKAFENAIITGELSHDGSEGLTRHVGNACRGILTQRDTEGEHLWVIYKERPDSPHKIDAAMAAVLAWEARRDAVQEGVLEMSIYENQSLMVVG